LGVKLWFLSAMLSVCAVASPESPWSVAQSKHFAVYSQGSAENAQSALVWFERLRAFFKQDGIIQGGSNLEARPPVIVIGFRSKKEYSSFRLRTTADAYYVGTESQDYIVMPSLGSRELGLAAHEYTHLILRNEGLHLPYWMNEGLAEFFSTVRISNRGCELGGALPARIDLLKHRPWRPLRELLAITHDSPIFLNRDDTAIFYSESWALVNMLISSSDYAPRFGKLMAALNSGVESSRAIKDVYGTSLESITRDLQAAVNQRRLNAMTLPAIAPPNVAVEQRELSEMQSSALLADLLLAEGEFDRAQTLYQDLARRSPENARNLAALGSIAFRRGNTASALQFWRQAIEKGITDAGLCYRYAVLAQDAGLPPEEIRHSLELALHLKPDFDDAHYKLALLENTEGDFVSGVRQLQAMRTIMPDRAYAYWTAMAYALTELDRRPEAERAAAEALKAARNASERSTATQLAYVARTDLTVQFATDASGHSQLVTTRVPHGSTNWNPFIEPTDRIRRVEGTLREVECSQGQLTGFQVDTQDGRIELSVSDPQRVMIRNGPSEFTCGTQTARRLEVEYAMSKGSERKGLLRGMLFR
jgi:tetratricopeptide (TPR) repeat protein